MRFFLVPVAVLLVGCTSAATGPTRLAVIGDYGDGSHDEGDVAAMVSTWLPQAIFTTGDNNYPAGAAASFKQNVDLHYGGYIAENRFFPALGNHDWDGDHAQPYLDHFQLPGNERYYRERIGVVDVFVLDSDPREPDGTDADSVQARWLRDGLLASDAPWQIVVFHHPPYASCEEHDASDQMRWPFAAWGAEVVLSGHCHFYERRMIGGVYYIVNGAGGAPLSKKESVPPQDTAFDGAHGAQLITATPEFLQLDFFSVENGEKLIDTVQIWSRV